MIAHALIALGALSGAQMGLYRCGSVASISIYAQRGTACPDERSFESDVRWVYYAACVKYGSLSGLRVVYTRANPCGIPHSDGCVVGNDVFVRADSENPRLYLRHEFGHVVDDDLDLEHSDRDYWSEIERGWP